MPGMTSGIYTEMIPRIAGMGGYMISIDLSKKIKGSN